MRWAVAALAAFSIIGSSELALAQQAGQLISADPIVETPAGMQAWRISYWTTTAASAPIRATCMVVAPREAIPPQPRQVIAWTHGTWGVVQKCAPSLSPNFWSWTAGLQAVSRGYTVVAPDYPGLGSDGVHGLLAGREAARSVLDAVRAAGQIPGAVAGKRFAVWGESQGGHAAIWTGQRARHYAPDLDLVGVAAAAPATYLVGNMRQGADPSARTFLTAYTMYSWSRFYDIPLSTVAGPQSRGIITRLSENNCISFGKTPKLGTILGVMTLTRNLRNVDLGRIEPWAGHAWANSVKVGQVEVPMLVAQNPTDKIVAPAVTRHFARDACACAAGKRVRWIDINGKGHETSASDTAAVTLEWIGDRFAGRPAPSNCGKF
jgi:pimeloyl-ACP methyl ester carboxylesterase